MSMISSLIDELRKSADEWNGSNMFELARMCSEAADTIWQLRDDLQRANAAVQDAEHDESMAWDRVRKAESENAKLRELVRDMWHWIEDSNACDVNEHGEAMNCAYCGHYGTVRKGLISCKLYERMRELEVGE